MGEDPREVINRDRAGDIEELDILEDSGGGRG